MPSRTNPSTQLYSRPSAVRAAADAIPILVDGEYQIFHLSTPPNTIRHPPRLRSTWSRLRSQDLVTWKRDEVEALHPGKSSDSPDADGAWTGSAVVGLDGNLHLFYTGYNLSQDGKQVILHAQSKDKQGTHFSKSPSPIQISGDISQFEDIDFRDAHVSWNESENCFWMLVATRLRNGPYWTRGCLALLTSPDLACWTIDPNPFYAPNDMFCPECPEIFSLPNGKWYLVYSRFHGPNAGTVYRIADSPRGPFRTPRAASGGRFDARRWYAAKSCPKLGDPSRRIYFGWIADKLDGQWSWGGDMGIPREVSANEEGHLIITPSREFLDATFSQIDQFPIPPTLQLESVGQTATHFPQVFASEYLKNYYFEFSIGSYDAASFGLMFRTDKDMAGHRLVFNPASSEACDIALLKCPPPLDDFWADQYNLHLPREVDGPEIARHPNISVKEPVIVIVRSNVLEIFVGGKCISYRLPENASLDNGLEDLDSQSNINGEMNGQNGTGRKHADELGVFVEDGSVELTCLCLRRYVDDE